jgi:hypothetical protein
MASIFVSHIGVIESSANTSFLRKLPTLKNVAASNWLTDVVREGDIHMLV